MSKQFRAEKTVRVVPVPLGPKEVGEAILRTSTDEKEKAKREDELRSVTGQYRNRIRAKEEAIQLDRRKVIEQVEYREVPCEKRYYYTAKKIRIVRADNGEQLEEWDMTAEEAQLEIELAGALPTAGGR